jgi:hypothetical protein
MDDFSLVQTIDRLCQRIVIGVPTLPTDGSRPAPARRSVYFMDKYWADTKGGARTFARLQQVPSNLCTPKACNGHRKIVVQAGRYSGGGANPFILPYRIRCLHLSNASRKMTRRPTFLNRRSVQTNRVTTIFV